jgi:hypothetical protein
MVTLFNRSETDVECQELIKKVRKVYPLFVLANILKSPYVHLFENFIG